MTAIPYMLAAACIIVPAFVLALVIANSPEGYEDETGWHSGRERED